MKKSLLMLGLAVAAMSSCTNDEVIDMNQSNQKAIGFESFVNKGTRAISETSAPSVDAGLKKFYVDAYYLDNTTPVPVFEALEVKDTLGGTIWWGYDATKVKYWTANTYYFAAYANGNDAESLRNVSFANKILTIPNYTVTYTTAAETKTTTNAPDLVAAIKEETGRLQRTEKVSFTFKHLLTKIKFHVVNNNPQGLTVDITDVVVSNVKNTGTFASTYSTGDWTPAQSDWNTSGGAAVANFIPITAQNLAVSNPNATNDEVTSDEFYVIPQALTDDGIKISFTANYKQGESIVSTQDVDLTLKKVDQALSLNHTSWTPGYSYVYTIGLPQSATPIEFGTPSVSTWKDGGTITLQ